VYYGNKTSQPLINFTTTLYIPETSKSLLSLQAQPAAPLIAAGAQLQQVITVTCQGCFPDVPLIHLNFTNAGVPVSLVLRLPILINKFFKGTSMGAQDFFTRWKNLSIPSQEVQKIFKAAKSMDTASIKSKISGFGLEVLESVDPKPDNYVGAGIIVCEGSQIGCLMRLEPSRQAQMYRLTIRSAREEAPGILSELLSQEL